MSEHAEAAFDKTESDSIQGLIDRAYHRGLAEARATAEAEIAELRAALDEGITATYGDMLQRTAWRSRAARLLAAPPTGVDGS